MRENESFCCENRLMEAAWRDLDEPSRCELESHLEECAACRHELEALRWTLDTIERVTPSIDVQASEHDWKGLETELDRIDRRRIVRSWALRLAASVALVAVGYFLGAWPVSSPTPEPSATVVAGESDQLASYLDRAEPMLMILANQPNVGVELVSYRERAYELAVEAARLRMDLTATEQQRGISLVAELELIFLQWSNLGDRESTVGSEILQGTLDRRAVLFKLSLERLRGEPQASEV